MNSLFVFIHPSEIIFSNDSNDTKQTISIYNPYEFTITFSFKCTRPNAFFLSSTQGEILSRYSLDIDINLIDRTVIEEKFRIEIYSANKRKKLGEKTIKVIKSQAGELGEDRKPKVVQQQQQNDSFHDLDPSPSCSGMANALKKYPEYKKSIYNDTRSIPNQFLIYSFLAICITILMLPHEETNESTLNLFQVSVNLKLVAAYVLGIVTVFIIRN